MLYFKEVCEMKNYVWKSIIAVVAVFCCVLSADAREPEKATSSNAEVQTLIDKSWAAQDQEMRLTEIDESIKYLEQAVKLEPGNHDILIELSDEYYQRGDNMPRTSDAEYTSRQKWFKKGLETAEKAIAIKETAASHYWVATNLAAYNENEGTLAQAGIFLTLNGHMDWVKEHDAAYKYGASARFWSRVFTRVPSIVIKMVGEDPERIYGELKEAIASEPNFIDNYLFKAEFLNYKGEKEEALATLDTALKIDPNAFPKELAYNRHAQRKAKVLWKEWTGKDYPNK
jgi:tetratricopeptide (TPR) repeat protein